MIVKPKFSSSLQPHPFLRNSSCLQFLDPPSAPLLFYMTLPMSRPQFWRSSDPMTSRAEKRSSTSGLPFLFPTRAPSRIHPVYTDCIIHSLPQGSSTNIHQN